MTKKNLEEPQALQLIENENLGRAESDTRQFVTFIAGDEVFAVDMAPVQEIIRVPDVVRVPLAPPTLEGLANLRGKGCRLFPCGASSASRRLNITMQHGPLSLISGNPWGSSLIGLPVS